MKSKNINYSRSKKQNNQHNNGKSLSKSIKVTAKTNFLVTMAESETVA